MSIQTELARIKGAKADLKSWVEENGVTVPDGTLIDGLVTLAKTVETGGGGSDTQIDGLIDRSITEISNSRVTSIGKFAFYGCSNVVTVHFPAVTSISDNAFYSCKKLTAADFPAVKNIGSSAFQSCISLTTADYPAVTSIGNVAFMGCSNLTTLILRNTNNVCTLSNTNALNGTLIKSGTGYIYVPAALVDSYKTATNWATYANQIRAIEDYPDITGGAA